MTTLQKTFVTATIATLAGVGIYEAHHASQLRKQVHSLRQQQAPLMGQIQQLQSERNDMANRLAALAEQIAKNKTDNAELLRLRGEVGLLRRQNQIPGATAPDTNQVQALNKGFGSLGEYLSVENVSDAGTSTPEALLQTFVWAIREGKVNRLEEIESMFGGQNKPGDVVGQIPESQAAVFKIMQSAFTNAAGFHLSSKPINDGQKYRVRLDTDPINGNQNNAAKSLNMSFVLERKNDGWSFGNPADDGSK